MGISRWLKIWQRRGYGHLLFNYRTSKGNWHIQVNMEQSRQKSVFLSFHNHSLCMEQFLFIQGRINILGPTLIMEIPFNMYWGPRSLNTLHTLPDLICTRTLVYRGEHKLSHLPKFRQLVSSYVNPGQSEFEAQGTETQGARSQWKTEQWPQRYIPMPETYKC